MTKFTDKLDESLLGVMRGVMPNAPFFPEEVSESRVLSQARQQILEAIEEELRKTRKNGYNSGWSASERSKGRKYICETCKEVKYEALGITKGGADE